MLNCIPVLGHKEWEAVQFAGLVDLLPRRYFPVGAFGTLGTWGTLGTFGLLEAPGALGVPGVFGAPEVPEVPGALGAPGVPGALGAPGTPGTLGTAGPAGSSAPHCAQTVAVGSFFAPQSGQVFSASTVGGLKHIFYSYSFRYSVLRGRSEADLLCNRLLAQPLR